MDFGKAGLKRYTGMNPVARAVIAAKWSDTALNAQIHAYIGGDGQKLVNEAGRVLFVVLGAAMATGLDADMPDIKIVRGAVNAIFDQAGEAVIDELRRASIISGLHASARLLEDVPRKVLVDCACELHLKLRYGHVLMSDFEGLTA